MVGSRGKTVVILGPAGAGKSTVTGCMLFKVSLNTSVERLVL